MSYMVYRHEQHGHEQHGHEQHGYEQHGRHEQHGHGHESTANDDATTATTGLSHQIMSLILFWYNFTVIV